jgi:serine/threonine protein kinase
MTFIQKVVDVFRSPSPPPPAIPNNEIISPISGQIMQQQQQFQGLQDFEIYRTLGTGSYGRVLLVRHRETNVFYALKKLRKGEIVRLRQVEHTNNECRLLRLANEHPFIVGLRGCFQDTSCLYLVLDYVPGGELFTLLRKLRTLPAFVAQFYAAQVALTLAYLHERNVLYRDLKPENLLLHRSGYLRLADFGFAKQLPPDGDGITWTFCGTPEYLAPEIIASTSGYGKGADWWALGVLIYEMLAGQPPFYHDNHLKLYDLIVNGPTQFPPGFDPLARDLVQRLLEKTATRRLGVLALGPQDVLQHAWFRGVDWAKLRAEQLRAPFKPKVIDDGDASNFDFYPEEDGTNNAPIEDCYYDKFPDFPIVPS